MTWLLAALLLSSADQALPPDDATLEQVLQLLRERSPQVELLRMGIPLAQAELVQAGTHPNPTLNYGGTFLASGQNTGAEHTHMVSADIPILIFGQRGLRMDLARLGVSRARSAFNMGFVERSAMVRQTFASLLARQAALEAMQQAKLDIDRIAEIVRLRAASGDRSQYDALRLQIESRTIEVDVSNAIADVKDASGRLAAQLGLPGWHPRAVGKLIPVPIERKLEVLWNSALERRPSLQVARQSVAMAKLATSLSRRERLPIPTFSGGVGITRGADSILGTAGLSLPIPLFDRGQGAVARSEAEAKRSALEAEAVLREAHADLERALAVLEERQRALTGLEQDTVERLPLLRSMAENSYREGRGSILELLDSMRTLKDFQARRFSQLEAVKLAEIDVEVAAGLLAEQ